MYLSFVYYREWKGVFVSTQFHRVLLWKPILSVSAFFYGWIVVSGHVFAKDCFVCLYLLQWRYGPIFPDHIYGLGINK